MQLPGQGSLQVLFQELAVPAIAALKRQVHAVPDFLTGHGLIIGEQKANTVYNPARSVVLAIKDALYKLPDCEIAQLGIDSPRETWLWLICE